MIRKYVVVGAIAGLLSLLLLQSASALIGRNTFQHEAYLDQNGRHVWVTAQIACTAGEKLSVEVTVTQESSLARGWGKVNTFCAPVDLGDPDAFQDIPVRVVARGRETFESGPAIATGLAITKDRGKQTDVRQWQPAAGIAIQ